MLHDVHDQLEIVRPVTKWAERVIDPARIPGAVREAFRQMATGRPRPVEIEIPPETLAEKADVELLDPSPVAPEAPDPEQVAAAADLLLAASSPLVVAGGGVNLGRASRELTAVVEFLQAPVLTTREGKGAIDDRNPLSVGTAWSNKRLRPVIDAADVILAVGTRFSGMGTNERQRIIQLDVDAAEIGKQAPVEIPIAGDARLSLELLLVELDARGKRRASRADDARVMRRSVEQQLRAIGPGAGMVDVLREAIPEEAILAVGTTTIGYMCHQHFPVYESGTYLTTSYMGTLGACFPIALGAKVARPDRPVVAIKGDGGMLFAATELATAMQYGINTVTVVFNDNAFGNSNRDQRERFGGREIGTELRNPDFAALARSFGAAGEKVSGIGELGPVLKEAFAADRPTVIECPMDRLPSLF
jgi:acetolactate synthase-1/2/3 large subunit